MKMSMEEVKVRDVMRSVDFQLHAAVRERDWAEVAALDKQLEALEGKIAAIRKGGPNGK